MAEYWYWLVLIVLVYGLMRFLRSPWFRGKRGEFKVHFWLSLLLNRKTYHLFKNVTLPTDHGTTQIDHLVVSPYGIFVIETKNMGGWIFGGRHQRNWTQAFFRLRNRFQNPLRQNYAHVAAVRELLGVNPDKVHNVVVFTGPCSFKSETPPQVVQGVFGLARYIRAQSNLVFFEDEVRRFKDVITANRLKPSLRNEWVHVRNVKKQMLRKQTGCPRCGGEMVERFNKSTGEPFLGCKRFPRCKGTRRLS